MHETKELSRGTTDLLLELNYPDSIYDVRLFLTKDGRRRGLWVFLEEDSKRRTNRDGVMFNRGVTRLLKDLVEKKFDINSSSAGFELCLALQRHFDPFFGHRTESKAVRLSWKQVKRLAARLTAAHKSETEKTEEDE